MIARGKGFLIAQQQEDGSWIETTRPPGNVSYAQRISTTGWATLALLATRESSAGAGRRFETVTRPSWLVTRLEIGPAASTSNGCATLFPARSSSSVPTTRR